MRMDIEEGRRLEIEAESGIRQRCTASTVLFKMVTFKIIEHLRRKTEGVIAGGRRVCSLFFADDGLLLARGEDQARKSIQKLREVGSEYGLNLNEEKSECLMFNMERNVEEIEGVRVVEQIKYLGVKVYGKMNLYDGHRERMTSEAKRMSNLTHSVIEKSCHSGQDILEGGGTT